MGDSQKILDTLVERYAQRAAGAARTAFVLEVFGRRGMELAPLLDKLASRPTPETLDHEPVKNEYEAGVRFGHDRESAWVELIYPRSDGHPKEIRVGLEDMRSADSIRIHYDFQRDGWSIMQASRFVAFPDNGDPGLDDPGYEAWEDWQEVAFVQAWARQTDACWNLTDDGSRCQLLWSHAGHCDNARMCACEVRPYTVRRGDLVLCQQCDGKVERKDGEAPGCCEAAATHIFWDTERDDDSAGWTLMEFAGGDEPTTLNLTFCPHCGAKLPE